ncbi:MAG TPA: MogA/MoaB family molybdenum cofactor biosynthesis protein [Bryobacteraceae bacterium]|nr:MogA/MoaB family molybdenum cofactor biosynthesis protein [Bryobacteraceae bacterium]HOL71941.1 MogA/MoaB family molybdenum cofactor biosynthesis protein [Bryobacteraceae bacterium]HOQ44582.1 MogA/MoaB family molybdenum cofactor biosynthesis protein [Bryobacteraceae bacterium]HPQ14396.1 MogA/MoaB family molybdenum cofactor biosynthesis protein [Bryobacteraceae bacterium]HPU70901.1 MogA/MoaB family molybdenum cofactor biosynthesis protein [Bryobacteraceae bacterium]
MIKAAVLTISDSVFAGKRIDCSGPAVRERLERMGWSVAVLEVVPDDFEAISKRLATLADGNQISAIFTTGGTGIAARDVTPEATRAVLDREIPGLAELMRERGRNSTPLAALSRGVAGTRGQVLLVNLPGSPRGAVESLDAIMDVLPHALELLRGETEHATGALPE